MPVAWDGEHLPFRLVANGAIYLSHEDWRQGPRTLTQVQWHKKPTLAGMGDFGSEEVPMNQESAIFDFFGPEGANDFISQVTLPDRHIWYDPWVQAMSRGWTTW